MQKKFIVIAFKHSYILKIVLSLVLLLGCSGCAASFNSAEPCEWCQKTKTKEVEKELGGKCYICENCFTHCVYCGNSVANHYSSVTGMEVFVCKECYNIDMQMMIENGVRENMEE